MSRQILLVALMVLGVALLAGLTSLLVWQPGVFAAESHAGAGAMLDPQVLSWAYLAAALSTGLASLGAAYAVASVGAAAVGALAEKPELFGRVIILVGLAEGIAIYGLIVSVLILNKL
ncbi:ATP synthase subunit C [Thiorhodococcus minor]|uniref:H+transporting two-sector ATPase C subunit n=1 Tax=Thiorhodococcus minor TaxID=57489 RepID=A0A6M0JWH2_9GAMM|nr:ATP synthase subunit C [Thiorhodococcus minor]NEV61848.1 H+transporting two-sector ATPase C subunit [Thiorhodococcus minor]